MQPARAEVVWNFTRPASAATAGERHVVMQLFEDEDGLYDTDPNVTPRFYLLSPYDEDGTGGEVDGTDETQAAD